MYLPEEVKLSQVASNQTMGNGIINNGEYFSIREARSPRYQKEGLDVARYPTVQYGAISSLPPYPWRECGQAPSADCSCTSDHTATSVDMSSSLETCSKANKDFDSYNTTAALPQQIRWLATYSSAEIRQGSFAKVTCKAKNDADVNKPIFSNVFDPYENDRTQAPQYLFTSPAPSIGENGFDYSSAVSANGTVLEITFLPGAVAPYILQFDVSPSNVADPDTKVSVEVECVGEAGSGFTFEGDSQKVDFKYNWVNGWTGSP